MPSSDYTPDVADVALFLRTRTRDTNGVELGTFTSATRPTNTEVSDLIADTVVNMEDDLGVDIDPRLWSSAKRVTALRAAMAIEVSYFSEQVAADRSVYPQLKEWYEEDLDKLNTAIVETAEGGDPGTDAGEDTPVWGGGDLPFPDGLSPSGVDLRLGSTWPEALGAFHEGSEHQIAAATGTQADAAVASPNPGSLMGYLRKIRDLLTGTLNVNVVSTVSGAGGLTDAELRASPVPVSGPATDAQIRATPIPVTSSALTDTQLRAAAVPVDPGAGPFPVSALALPLPVGAATEATLADLADTSGSPGDAAWVSGPGTVIALLKKIASSGAAAGLTDTELRATPVPVSTGVVHVIVDSGVTVGLTDTQLRATPVPVSGPLTDTQLRNSAVPVSVASLPLPSGAATSANQASILAGIGATTDPAATTTGSVIAQTRRIANLLAGTLTVGGTVAVSGSVSVTGPLTDTQLRASAVPISAASLPLPTGAATETSTALSATALGAPTDAAATTTGSVVAQLRRVANLLAGTLTVSGAVTVSGSVAVTGPLTDTQLRASAVPVSGPVTDTQLRASAVPVSLASQPLPTGASTETTLAAVNTAVGATTDAASTTSGSVIAHLRKIRDLLAATLTVSGTVAVSGSVAVTGTFWQATQPVNGTVTANAGTGTFAVSAASLPLPTGAALDATLTGGTQKAINRGGAKGATAAADVTSTASGADHQPLDVALYDNAGARLGTSGAPLRTDPTGTTTQPVSAASLPLPTGAATETSVGLAATALGAPGDAAATTTGSVIAQLRRIANLLAGTVAVSGTFWQATQPVSLASQPLPTGASTETTLAALLATAGATTDAASSTTGTVNAHLRSIAAALAGTLTVTGGGGGVQFAEDAVHTTGDLGTMALAVRKDTATALSGTDGDYTPLITDASGRQHVNVGTSVLPTGASTETSLAALLASVGATGDAAATGAGTLNAHLRSIAAALAGTLTVTGGGGGVQFAEDAVHTTGDLGTMALGVRKDTATALAGTDGDYQPMIFDASGKLHVNPGTVAVTGTFFQGTQPVSAASLPLPTGASTETTLASVLAILGASADAASSTTGTVNAHLRSIAAALAGTLTASITGSVAVTGTFLNTEFAEDVAHTTGDKGIMAMGVRTDTAAALAGTTGDYQPMIFDNTGRLWTNPSSVTQPVSAASLPLPTGASTETTLASVLAILGASADAASSTTGTINAHLRSIAAALAGTLTVSISGSPSVTVTGTVTSLNNAATSGGWSATKVISAASTNAGFSKASAGQVGGWYIFNANAATRYLKLYNKASAPTVGTDTPVMTIPIPAGGAANMEWTNGIAFATGIAYAMTTGSADSDTGAVAAGDIIMNLAWK